MITIGLVPLFVIACIAALLLSEDTVLRLRGAFAVLSWLPFGIAASALGLPGPINLTLGYLLIFFLILACLSSLLFLLLGTRILLAAKRRGEACPSVFGATVIASLPLAAVVLYALVRLVSRAVGV